MIVFAKSYKELQFAHSAVTKAVDDGLLVRPTACSNCFKEAHVVAHHRDYTKPLEVVWLCRKCHSEEHGREGFNQVPDRPAGFETVRLYPHVSKIISRKAKSFPKRTTRTHIVNALLENTEQKP